ncbi:hypothetical protein Bbelb_216100 [Branchiostoma belcheri]|nr:hypothetical protein Bbelb_216100 [Branchiostoma belcheri]
MPSARESFILAIEICFTVVSLVGLVILVTGMVMLFMQYGVERGVGLTVTLVGLGCVAPAFAYLTIGICVVGCQEEPESPLFGRESSRRRGAIRRRPGGEDAAPVVNPSFVCDQGDAAATHHQQQPAELNVAAAVLNFGEDVLRLESLEVDEEGYVLEVVTVQTEYVEIAEDVENVVTMTTDEENGKIEDTFDDTTEIKPAVKDVTDEDVITEDSTKDRTTPNDQEDRATAATIVVKPRAQKGTGKEEM